MLIVDDDPAMRLMCAINLELEGFIVLEAADGLSALARARSEQPDLVVTDVSMPQLDGFGLAEALRRDRRTRRIPLVFLSGETNVTYEIARREARCACLPRRSRSTRSCSPRGSSRS